MTGARTIPEGFPAADGPRTGPSAEIAGRQPLADTVPRPALAGLRPAVPEALPGDQLAALTVPERAELNRAAAAMPPPGRGRHSAPRTPAGKALGRHGARLASFGFIGALVLVLGIAVQALLIAAHAGRYGSYAGQAVFSIEASFALNWRLTWRDRQSPFWPACWRFNVQKLVLTVPNLALYALLLRLGLGWLAANLAVTAVFLAANYATGDLWTFTASRVSRKGRGDGVPPAVPMPAWWQPPVSAVIPCKGNQATILATVESLLAQDYPGLLEVILVGDVGDPTWAALTGVRDPRVVMLEQEKTPGRRDPNVKRDKGIRAAAGEVIALVDSDIVMEPGWLSRAVGLLGTQGGGLVGGGMRAIHPHKFWPRFVDRNVLAAKTSRIPHPYRVTAANFGHRGRKPPVTANAVVTRAAYDACPLDVAWAYGYEDYEWMHRLADAGCPITMDPGLTGDHHHREKFSQLVREYRRSAHGCAQFVRRHPGSVLAGKRRAQALGIPLAAVAVLAAGIAAAAAGHGLAVLALALGALAVLSGREVVRSRSIRGVVYPVAALALGGVFTISMAGGLLRRPEAERPPPVWESGTGGHSQLDTPPLVRRHRRRWLRLHPLYIILMVQAALSLSFVWADTAFSDEALYLHAGLEEWQHILHGVPIAGQSFNVYFSGTPQIYPLLGGAVSEAGGLAAARILSLLFMLAATVFLYDCGKRLFSTPAATAACALWMLSEPTLKLGAFATYDALSVLFMVMAAWAVIRSFYSHKHAEWVLLAAACMALSDLTAYSYAIMDPAVICSALALWVRSGRGWKQSLFSAAWMTTAVIFLVSMFLTLFHDWQGVLSTTVTRHGTNGITSTPFTILMQAWEFQGLVLALALLGLVVAWRVPGERRNFFSAVMLTLPLFIVPLEQVNAATTTSEGKHVAVGVWLGALAAGYAVNFFMSHWASLRHVSWAAGVLLLIFPAWAGYSAAHAQSLFWADSSALTSSVRFLAAPSFSGRILLENPIPTEYDLPGITSGQWDPLYASDARGQQTYVAGIRQHQFAIVGIEVSGIIPGTLFAQGMFSQSSTELAAATSSPPNTDNLSLVVRALEQSKAYRIVEIGPYNAETGNVPGAFILWKRVPVPVARHAASHHRRHA